MGAILEVEGQKRVDLILVIALRGSVLRGWLGATQSGCAKSVMAFEVERRRASLYEISHPL